MVSSLAAQLAQGASLNSYLLADRSKRKWPDSYLFTEREADQHDLDAIRALGLNGLMQLRSLEPKLASYEDSLFSESTRSLDRTLLSKEQDEELNIILRGCLRLLGPYVLDPPTGKVLEWFVQRYRFVFSSIL